MYGKIAKKFLMIEVIDVYIKELRKKLQLDCITTIRNVGYKIGEENEKIIYLTNNGSYAMQYVCGYVFCGGK